jgi:hypothetical protein
MQFGQGDACPGTERQRLDRPRTAGQVLWTDAHPQPPDRVTVSAQAVHQPGRHLAQLGRGGSAVTMHKQDAIGQSGDVAGSCQHGGQLRAQFLVQSGKETGLPEVPLSAEKKLRSTESAHGLIIRGPRRPARARPARVRVITCDIFFAVPRHA